MDDEKQHLEQAEEADRQVEGDADELEQRLERLDEHIDDARAVRHKGQEDPLGGPSTSPPEGEDRPRAEPDEA